MSRAILVLTSGGIDSTALISFHKKRKAKLSCFHFQYGQRNAASEKTAAKAVCEHYDVTLQVIPLGFRPALNRDEVLCRNALFVIAAASLGGDSRISIGIHTGSPYYDSNSGFLSDVQRLLDGYFSGTRLVEAPFIEFTKKQISDYCAANKVPVHLTYSCQRQNRKPCGKCSSCVDRLRYFGEKIGSARGL